MRAPPKVPSTARSEVLSVATPSMRSVATTPSTTQNPWAMPITSTTRVARASATPVRRAIRSHGERMVS